MLSLEDLRREIPILERTIYLNSASSGPIPLRVYNAVKTALDSMLAERRFDKLWVEGVELSRSAFAALVGASVEEVAATPNVSIASSILATGLSIPPNRNKVVMSEHEFPSNINPWLAAQSRGVDVVLVKHPPAQYTKAICDAIDDRTLLVCVSHVLNQYGVRVDLPCVLETAHRFGAYVYVDAYQSLGPSRFDVHKLDIDFLSCGTAKWLLGIEGAAFLYVRRDLVDALEPGVAGWMGVEDLSRYEEWWRRARDARRFHTGTLALLAFTAAYHSLSIFLSLDPSTVESRCLHLSGILIEGLRDLGCEVRTPFDPKDRLGIVNFWHSKMDAICRSFDANRVRYSIRGGGIRLSPHAFNTEEEVEKVLAIVRHAIAA